MNTSNENSAPSESVIDYQSSENTIYARLDKGWSTDLANKPIYSWTELLSGISNDTINHEAIENISNFTGSSYGDIIQGSSLDEIINGMGGNDYINGGAGANSLFGGEGDDLIKTGGGWGNFVDGGEGIDTLNYYGQTDSQGVYVRMDKGWATDYQNKLDYSWTEINSKIAAGTIDFDSFEGIENFTGTEFKDVIQGSSGDNIIKGGGGSDFMNGGDGFDIASYYGTTANGAGVNVRLDQGFTISMSDKLTHSWTELLQAVKTGSIEADKLVNFEGAIGTQYNDVLQGNSGDNLLEGAQGDDYLSGGKGDDILIGGSGMDLLVGGEGNDTFFTDESDKGVFGGEGLDIIANMNDDNGDHVVDVDLSASKFNSVEGFVADRESSVDYNVNVSLDKVAAQSEGTYDDMFFAIGVDTLTFAESATEQSTQELEGSYEAELVALLGLDSATELQETVYATDNNTVTVIEDIINDSDSEMGGFDSAGFMTEDSIAYA
ncbi:calcium-binding protein [Pseudoalteromonas sp.]|uniref:calcium-binding protein n=1 Tax=unclassified Pseudoalteromonas TaxID=194690 RepID=UPI003F9A2E1D